jgi:hypothetical protein
MTHSMIAACGVLVAGTLTLSAQAPAPAPQTPRPSPTTPARTDDRTMTVTGCLKPADASQTAPAPSASPSTSAPASRFLLTNVEADGGSPGGSSSASAAKPSKPAPEDSPAAGTMSGAAGKQYVLVPDAGVNLAAHLNHKIRITGKLADKADTKTAPAETRAGATTSAAIAVSAVTMVSASCTPATD